MSPPSGHPSIRRVGDWLRRFVPPPPSVDGWEWLRACCGALFGILATAWIARVATNDTGVVPLLVAPMGASSVLLFAAPSSPLAQPWSVVGGNTLAAVVGVTCAQAIGNPTLAAAVAVAAAIALMFPLRCLHPPAGAVALTAVLGGPAIAAQGYGFALMPVALNSAVLLLAALLFNGLTGRSYPHVAAGRPVSHGTADVPPGDRVGFTVSDLDAVLKAQNALIDVDRDDLHTLFRNAERRAWHRLHGAVVCGDIMSCDVVTVTPDTRIERVHHLLYRHRIKAMPVVDGQRRVLGIVTLTDGLTVAGQTAADLMSAPVRTATAEQPIADLVPIMSDEGVHHVPVVDSHRRLLGIVTQSDLIAGLYRGGTVRATESGAVERRA